VARAGGRLKHVKALALTLVLASLTLAVGCGDDESSTSSTGASEASGAASSSANADAQATARKAQTAIETYAGQKNGSYAGASATELSDIDSGLSSEDLEVVSTDSSYTITVLSESGTTFSVDGEQGGAPDHTCDPPSGSGCSESGDWD
jgi:hypothetical protein